MYMLVLADALSSQEQTIKNVGKKTQLYNYMIFKDTQKILTLTFSTSLTTNLTVTSSIATRD